MVTGQETLALLLIDLGSIFDGCQTEKSLLPSQLFSLLFLILALNISTVFSDEE